MSENVGAMWYYSNQYNEQAACGHCKGIIRHEHWCSMLNQGVYYACQIVADPSKLTVGDGLILHSLAVIWGVNSFQGRLQ